MGKPVIAQGARHHFKIGDTEHSFLEAGARDFAVATGSWGKHRYLFWFGQIGSHYVLARGDHLEEALEYAIDWIVDHAPGLLCDEQVEEEYRAAVAEGLDDDAARERAEMDCTMFGHSGIHYVQCDDWGVAIEDPTRAQLLEFLGRKPTV